MFRLPAGSGILILHFFVFQAEFEKFDAFFKTGSNDKHGKSKQTREVKPLGRENDHTLSARQGGLVHGVGGRVQRPL